MAAAERGDYATSCVAAGSGSSGRGVRGRHHPPALSRSRRSVPQPLATFRGGRRRSLGANCQPACPLDRRRTGAHAASISRSRAFCSTPAPALDGATSTRPPGRRSRARRARGGRTSSLRRGRFLGAHRRAACAADAHALARLDTATLAQGFQVAADNPLIGLEGRAALLRRLGVVAAATPAVFGTPARLGTSLRLPRGACGGWHVERRIPAAKHCCARWGPSGRARLVLDGVRAAATAGGIRRRVPRLPTIPPMGTSRSTSSRSGSRIRCWSRSKRPDLRSPVSTSSRACRSTATAASCSISASSCRWTPSFLQRRHAVDDEAIVEWRALTVIALDRIAAGRARRAWGHPRGLSARASARRRDLGGGPAHRRGAPRRRRTPGVDRQRRHRFLGHIHRRTEVPNVGHAHRRRSSADPAQVDAHAPQGHVDGDVPPPPARDRAIARLRSHARPAARARAHRDAADRDECAA